MYYRNERDLQAELAMLDFGLFKPDLAKYSRRELPVGNCRPDLLCVYIENMPDVQIWPHNWSHKHSYVIWVLRNKHKVSPENIAKYSYEREKKIQPILDDLINKNILTWTDPNKLSLSAPIKNMQANVVAVEAKLKNWREALSQAKHYKEFANIAIVAMDASNIPIAKTILAEFVNNGIGLCAVSPRAIDWVIRPRKSTTVPSHQKEYIVMSAAHPKTQTAWS